MRFFALATRTPDAESLGPAVGIKPKPNKLRKLFRRKPRRSPSLTSSLTSALSESFSELESVSSVENFRVVGHVEEILFGPEDQEASARSSRESTAVDPDESPEQKEQVAKSGVVVMKRELFSERTIYVDALDQLTLVDPDKTIERNETMRSVYVDALEGDADTKVEIKEAMEISVVAEVKPGICSQERTLD
jgi:hypothetical protein